MTEELGIHKVAPILKHYGVEAYFVENKGKIVKIYSNKGIFSLKKMDPHMGTDFIRQIQTLYQKGYNRIVPIYPTMDGRYAVLHENQLYYLMPWLSDEHHQHNRNEKQQKLFRELARIHTLSVKETIIRKNDRTEHYEKTIEEIDREQEFLESYLDRCEQRTYMSPFELLFCMYYHDISQALTFSKKKLTEWYNDTEEKEKERTVILHGKIANDHFVYDERGYGYFINFEKSKVGAPAHDLLPYLSSTLRSLPKRSEETVEALYTYFKHFPLKEDEMKLFLSYFAHPSPVIKTAEQFANKTTNKNERKAVQKLQRDFWLLKNTEYIIMRIDEIERAKQQQAQQQQQPQD